MLTSIRAIVREGRIELLDKAEIPDGTEVLITPVVDAPDFGLRVSESTLDSVWENSEDDVYAKLLG